MKTNDEVADEIIDEVIQRETFESYISAIGYSRKQFKLIIERNGPDYINPLVQVAWEIFQDAHLAKSEEAEWEQTAHNLDKLSLEFAFARLQKAEKKNQELLDLIKMGQSIIFDLEYMLPKTSITTEEKTKMSYFIEKTYEVLM